MTGQILIRRLEQRGITIGRAPFQNPTSLSHELSSRDSLLPFTDRQGGEISQLKIGRKKPLSEERATARRITLLQLVCRSLLGK